MNTLEQIDNYASQHACRVVTGFLIKNIETGTKLVSTKSERIALIMSTNLDIDTDRFDIVDTFVFVEDQDDSIIHVLKLIKGTKYCKCDADFPKYNAPHTYFKLITEKEHKTYLFGEVSWYVDYDDIQSLFNGIAKNSAYSFAAKVMEENEEILHVVYKLDDYEFEYPIIFLHQKDWDCFVDKVQSTHYIGAIHRS